MNITFLGGAETVTGSKFLIEAGETRVLVDCGLFQGYKWLRKRNRQPLPLDIESLDAVLLTHAHLDHSGYIPVLYKQGFRGAVYTHHATRDLSEILLADSGHLQEEEAHAHPGDQHLPATPSGAYPVLHPSGETIGKRRYAILHHSHHTDIFQSMPD